MVKENDLMAFVYYGRVQNVGVNSLQIYDVDHENEFRVNGQPLIEEAYSADSFDKTETVTMTQAAELLISAGIKPFTVEFVKSNGKVRKLRGRRLTPKHHGYINPVLGRSMVEDLELENGDRLRQVDHRTIKYLIIDNTKYVVK